MKKSFIAALVILILDQASKVLMSGLLAKGAVPPMTIIPGFFYLGYVENTGAAFGIFRNQNWPLMTLAAAALAAIVIWRKHFIGSHPLQQAAAGCIMGGIAGNLMDRIRIGAVIDFLEFHFGSYHYPNFNVADSAICTGVFLYLVYAAFIEGQAPVSCEEVGKPDTDSTTEKN